MQIILQILFVVSAVLLGSGILLWIWEKWFDSDANKYQINCSKVQLARTIISWGLTNIKPTGKKEAVNFKIYYHLHKKRMGVFYGSRKEIVLYVNNHKDVVNFIDTALHEVVHHKQYLENPRSFDKEYQKLLSSVGYENHPMEVEARKLAAEFTPACLEYLLSRNMIIKKGSE